MCLDLRKVLNPEDVQEMKRIDSLNEMKLIERIIHVFRKKDLAALKELADVMGIYCYSKEKDWLLGRLWVC